MLVTPETRNLNPAAGKPRVKLGSGYWLLDAGYWKLNNENSDFNSPLPTSHSKLHTLVTLAHFRIDT
jgi:hypothetical protein